MIICQTYVFIVTTCSCTCLWVLKPLTCWVCYRWIFSYALPRPSAPFLVILQSLDYITCPKSTTCPKRCHLVEKEGRPKWTTYPYFIIAAPMVTSTIYWDTCNDAMPWEYVCGNLGTLGNSLLESLSDLLSTIKAVCEISLLLIKTQTAT